MDRKKEQEAACYSIITHSTRKIGTRGSTPYCQVLSNIKTKFAGDRSWKKKGPWILRCLWFKGRERCVWSHLAKVNRERKWLECQPKDRRGFMVVCKDEQPDDKREWMARGWWLGCGDTFDFQTPLSLLVPSSPSVWSRVAKHFWRLLLRCTRFITQFLN